jgi:hypothetical protein
MNDVSATNEYQIFLGAQDDAWGIVYGSEEEFEQKWDDLLKSVKECDYLNTRCNCRKCQTVTCVLDILASLKI